MKTRHVIILDANRMEKVSIYQSAAKRDNEAASVVLTLGDNDSGDDNRMTLPVNIYMNRTELEALAKALNDFLKKHDHFKPHTGEIVEESYRI